jgi:hypothetical protein
MAIEWIVAGILFVTSVVLLSGRGSFLIAGYNTASAKQKGKYDREKLCRAVGAMLLFITIATLFLILLHNQMMIIVYLILVIVSVIVLNIYVNKKCKNNVSDVSEAEVPLTKNKNAFGIILGVGIGVITLIIILISFNSSKKPPVYSVGNGNFTISTEFGETVKLSDIKSVQLKNDLPAIGTKLNGLGIGTILKGKFSSKIGGVTLYVDTAKSPYIYITTTTEMIILNDQTKDKTQSLYEELNSDIKK